MKIAFMMASSDTLYFFKGIADKLLEQGHEVITLHAIPSECSGGPYNITYEPWHHFSFDNLKAFNPDKIIIWNGYHAPFVASTTWLKTKYYTLHAEAGWMSQRKYMYIDENIGGRSNIASYTDWSSWTDVCDEILNELKSNYVPGPIDVEPGYTLVPLQLEHDTSIVYDSPKFKTMSSFVGWVRHVFPSERILVKRHPKEVSLLPEEFLPLDAFPDSVEFYKGTCSMTDLAAQAGQVVGINSTSLIEARLVNNHVLQFGNNVFGDLPGTVDVKNRLLYLHANQIEIEAPQDWAIKKIISEEESWTPRTMKELIDERI